MKKTKANEILAANYDPEYLDDKVECEPVEEKALDEVTTVPVDEPIVSEEEKKPKIGMVCSKNGLNIRINPEEKASVLYVAQNTSELKIEDEDGDWYKVTTSKGVKGYCKKEFVVLL